MASRIKRPCSHPGCPALVDKGKCPEHSRQYERDRGSASNRMYDRRWQKARLSYLRRYPLCVECDKQGRVKAATIVDHIIPHKGDAVLFWDVSNWQPLCKTCHDRKTATEGGFGR